MRFAPMDITEEVWKLWDEGLRPTSIAGLLNITLQQVYDILDEGNSDYDDSMDGDHDSAMASAGFGTDEDYGYYGSEE